ncbi:uncharacterized protein LOC132704843 [Cylas formicarius]|uniref:uncharacterized protein LOC132704843 n=1 Tax=Cylas formicarius TaxID=197179 RepID=UPI0029584F0A|nr:uncharacterized protein LOC132704843 [Cylas formicarius]
MDRNQITGDPNHKSPLSVFGFDSYPGPSNLPQGNTQLPPNFRNANVPFSNLSFPQVPIQPIQPSSFPQVPDTFSFGSQRHNEQVVQFPFEIIDHGFGNRTFTNTLRGKRKTDSPPLQPNKQHITEEKMAEHLSKLHISSETPPSHLEPESVKHKRLYMCEEMRKLQADPIIPPCLMSQLQRPCMALVLWQPPSRLLPISDDNSQSSEWELNRKEGDSNSVCDVDQLDVDIPSGNVMEMDL